jgi:hypothetical protein
MHKDELAEIQHRVGYHPPASREVIDDHQEARTLAYEMMTNGADLIPARAGREKALFLTKVEEALFWLNAGIARGNAKRADEEDDE